MQQLPSSKLPVPSKEHTVSSSQQMGLTETKQRGALYQGTPFGEYGDHVGFTRVNGVPTSEQ